MTSASPTSTTAAIVGGVALAGTALIASLWNLFRRRIPDLTQEDLLPDPTNDLKTVRKLTEEDKAGIREAFGKSPDFVWILKDGDKLAEDDADDMATTTSFLVDFIIHIGENYGHIIKSADKDGNFQGAIILIPPVSTFLFQAYTVAAMVHSGKPPSLIWDDADRKARFQAFDGDMKKYHHEVMHDCMDDHWYVQLLGVAPSAQGKRVGTRLLQQAIHLAGDKPLFLDCHNGNVPYYEKYGFKVGKNYLFEAPKGAAKSKFFFNAMRRDPQ